MENLTVAWSAFQDVHFEILDITGKEEFDFQSIEYNAVEDLVIECKCIVAKFLANFDLKGGELSEEASALGGDRRNESVVTVLKKKSLRLQPMQLPEFDGSYAQWPSFRDLFRSLIHKNEELSNVQRLYYLKKALQGQAADLICDIELTDENYDTAWDNVQERFENKYPLVLALLDKIFKLPQMTKNDPNSARKLLDSTTQTVLSLTNLERPTEHWDDILIYITIMKLDDVSKEKWNERTANVTDVPKWKEMQDFLRTRYRSYDTSVTPMSSSSYYSTDKLFSPKSFHLTESNVHASSSASQSTPKPKRKCPACSSEKKDHRLRLCEKFKSQSPQQRKSCIEKNHLCYNCFSNSHSVSSCNSTYNCLKCQAKHHTMLHVDKVPEVKEQPVKSGLVVGITNAQRELNQSNQLFKHVLLATALIDVKNQNGVWFRFRALLDQGSQASFITEHAAQLLNLSRRNTSTMFESVGNHEIHRPNGVLSIEFMSSRRSPTMLPTFPVNTYILSSITNPLPSQRIEKQNWNQFSNLQLADPMFNEPGVIDLLLGGDIYPDILMPGLIKSQHNGLIAQKSALGWIIMGHVELTCEPASVQSISFCKIDCKHLQQFWELEEINAQKPLSDEEKFCDEHYLQTHHRTEEGRYVIRHQFKKSFGETLHLGKTKNLALFSQYRLERRFEKNPKLHRDYVKFVDELISSNYLEEIPKEEIEIEPEKSFYLPHHPVIRENSSTTKLRVVFNASIKSSNGTSLNDTMVAGPSLQNNLVDILVHVRKYPIAFAADVEKMYKRIFVDRRDCDYQRIVWRRHQSEPIKDYRLLILSDGFNSAPYLAIRTVHQLAEDERDQFPLASKIAKRDVYMDDVFSGGHTVDDALKKQRQLIGLFNAGGFCLRKWSSNADELLSSVPKEDLEVTFGQSTTVKTLGIYWHPSSDQFGFKINLPRLQPTVTKRDLLSEASRLFDPLGWLAPSIIIPKILFQLLWIKNISWDDVLPPEILEDWIKFRESLHHIEDIKVDRWLGNFLTDNSNEIHGFSDSSEKAYVAVVYMRTKREDGSIQVSQISAKTKVAPVNTVSLPNLELCGALLLARLLAKVQKALRMESNVKVTAWTDSMLVLWWLQSSPSRWKTFVANRTSEILQIIPANQWRHVPGTENPADCATRGVMPKALKNHSLWWHGPNWLSQSPDMWPNNPVEEPTNVDTQERKFTKLIATIVPKDSNMEVLQRFSSLRRLIRFTARLKRMAANARLSIIERQFSFITVPELKNSLAYWVKSVQARHFGEDISCLASNEQLLSKSKLLSLNPTLDEDGILRVGGRLKNANINYNQKHPIILPQMDHFTSLVVSEAHDKTLHGHIQLMINVIRQRFWIVGVRRLVKRCINNCKTCFRFRAKAKTQIMANLPKQRVNPSRTFSHCGVDYAGPIKLKLYKGGRCRTIVPGYVAVFVCLATRAIHLEAVSELTTEAFLAALKRFLGIHGFVRHMYSDNGTQFKGATTELEKLLFWAIKESEQHVAPLLANDHIEWHFNPPSAPHFGGIFEAGVKSMKYHVKRVLGNSNFTFEELSTLLYQTAGILNSRPICALKDDIDDLDALTPGHFVMLSAPTCIPEPSLLEINENRLNNWQRVQKAFQHIWQRWSDEYLQTLQQRNKWRKLQDNVSVGQLVLVLDNNLPPSKWLMGRIIEVYPDSEGIIRSVKLKLQKGTLVRPIVKICPLPMDADIEEDQESANEEENPGAELSGDNQSQLQES